MQNLQKSEVWFITGSQHLYGEKALKEVAENSKTIVSKINEKKLGLPLVFKPVLTTSDEIRKLCLEANHSPQCAGLILWMHTFSPAKMWINGLNNLTKPFLHLHTQFNQDLPWSKIDMDFMNLNQAAHGDREAGFAHTRMRLRRKIVSGHWTDPGIHSEINSWIGAAQAWQDMQGAKFVRFGDNMRQVAVTDGDKVSAEIKFGFSVNSHGIGDLVEYISKVGQGDIGELCSLYEDRYEIAKELKKGGSRHDSLREEARTEIALRNFLKQGSFNGFTTNFEDLHGIKQLPGLAVQRLMADGYGFGAEGDWKTCAMVRALKVMGAHAPGGTSFMEDYTYHLNPSGPLVLGAHMLEVCETIAGERPKLEIHPLGIGGKSDPVRLVFNAKAGPALNASLVDLGNRFRMVVNKVETINPPEPLPLLPVARAVWKCQPDFKTATAAWILAGGGHHTAYSNNVSSEQLEDFAEIAGIELVSIDSKTDMASLKQNLRTNEVYYHLSSGIGL